MNKTLDFLVNKNEANLLRQVFKSFKIFLKQRKLIKQKVEYMTKNALFFLIDFLFECTKIKYLFHFLV